MKLIKIFNKKKKREQAKKISAWIAKEEEDSSAWIAIYNESDFPVSKMVLSIVNIQDKASNGLSTPDEFRAFLSLMPPGKYYTRLQVHHGMNFLSGIEIAFIDKYGENWIRTGDGVLSKIIESPVQYYNLPTPISWEIPNEKIV